MELNLVPSAERLDFRVHNIDIGIRCGDGNWPELEIEKLMPYHSVPVCSPSYLQQAAALGSPEDLKHHVLIHEMSYQYWGEWLSSQGVEGVDYQQGVICQDPALGYNLAIRGQGVALLSTEIVAKEIASGELLAPLGVLSQQELAFYVIYRKGALENTSVKIFRDFLHDEARKIRP